MKITKAQRGGILVLVLIVSFLPAATSQLKFFKQEMPAKWNLYALLPELPRCDLPVSLSFGLDNCYATCPLQYGELQRLTKIKNQLALWLKPGTEANSHQVKCLTGTVQTVTLSAKQLEHLNRQFDRNLYGENNRGHETSIFLFSAQGNLVAIKPYNLKD